MSTPAVPPTVITGMQVRAGSGATFVRQIRGRENAEPVVMLHGNIGSSVFFEPLMRMMPRRFRPITLDLRGFGGSDPEPVDATHGVGDFADDALAALDALGIGRAHLLGWSLGGAVAMQIACDAPECLASLTFIAPVSPYGFGGTTDTAGTLLAPDGAGSGAGLAARSFVQSLADRDASADRAGARALLRRFYVGDGWDGDGADRDLENDLVASMLSTVVGPENYPGSQEPSPHWPGFAPGAAGVMNAISPVYLDISRFSEIEPKPPVLWVRGDGDFVISDGSAMDAAVRGRAGRVDGYPGQAAAPPQPMVAQTRAVLDSYAAAGGGYREVVMPGARHAPHLDALTELMESLIPHLDGATRD